MNKKFPLFKGAMNRKLRGKDEGWDTVLCSNYNDSN